MGKRLFDVLAAAVGLIILCPVFVVIAVLVKVTSRGPVVYCQERIGRRFRPFTIVKFRTMRQATGGPTLTVAGDPRITPFGRFLRRTKLDELPQLWNVLCGHMSLVGPRPEVETYVRLFRADYEEILSVRPGITDTASLEFRDEEIRLTHADDPELLYRTEILPRKIALAKDYVRDHSVRGDFVILLRTLFHL